MCGYCAHEWYNITFSDETGMSCYKILYGTGTSLHSWLDFNSWCEKLDAQLVTFESEEEQEQVLSRFIHDNKRLSNEDTWYLAIGLKRDQDSRAKRFSWVNGRPLIYSRWFTGQPDGDSAKGCGTWAFVNKTSKNGWANVGCGNYISHAAICESSVIQPKNMSKISPATRESTDRATSNSEFEIFNGEIVSMSFHLKNPSFRNFLEMTKVIPPLFDCEDADAKDDKIPYSFVCDHTKHCQNGKDERFCTYRKCDPEKEYECSKGHCIPKEARCDMYDDCPDGGDEETCQKCMGDVCCDGTCIPKHWYRDDQVDCSGCTKPLDRCDQSNEITDESESFGEDYDECLFMCNRNECIFPMQLKNGVTDCKGPEGPLDETIGALQESKSCVKWAPRCVYIKDRFGGLLGCRNKSHLHKCQDFDCPEGYAKCPNSYCIPIHYIQNGENDCPLGQDEMSNEDPDCSGNFACWGSKICLHPDLVCDGHKHCASGDDEFNCHVTCMDGFQCLGGAVTVTDFDKLGPLLNLTFIDPRTRYLDLSGVDLSANYSDLGMRGRFGNMFKLFLSHCKLIDAHAHFLFATEELRTVFEVDLSHNQIEMIASESMFNYMENLRVLDLSHNPLLVTISKGGLKPREKKSFLQHLDLSFTGISSVADSGIWGLDNLQLLNLSHTKINRFDGNAFPSSLKPENLDLRGAPLQDISQSLERGLTVYKHLYVDNFRVCCPQVRGDNIPAHNCHAPRDVISSCSHLIGEPFLRLMLWPMGVFAVLGNVLVIVCRIKWDTEAMKKAYGVFVTNLGLSDLCMGIYLFIIAAVNLNYADIYVLYEKSWRRSTLCKAAGFLSTFSSETSTFFICLITLDRFFAIKYPFGAVKFTRRSKIAATVLAWSVGFTLAVIPLVFDHWKIYSSNGMCLGLPLTTERQEGWHFSFAVFIVLNFVMFIGIAFGQLAIFRAMSSNRMPKTTMTCSFNQREQDITVAKHLFLIVLSDFLCWFPIGQMGLLSLGGYDIGGDAYAWSAVVVLPVNSAINPILYTVPVMLTKWEEFKRGKAVQVRVTGSSPVASSAV